MSEESDNDETIDTLLKEALEEFEQCRHKLDKITGRKLQPQHQSVNVSPFTPALENRLGMWCPRGRKAVGLRSQGVIHQVFPHIPV